jgi:hypothetical protein
VVKEVFGLLRTISTSTILLTVYLGAWGAIYRIPCAPDQVIDLRSSKETTPYFVNICAGLASNTHGYPGHAYIGWTEKGAKESIESMETAGYCPRFSRDQIPSLVQSVPGILVRSTGSSGNARNLTRLVVICSHEDYERTRAICKDWKCSSFQVGKRDCVTLVYTVSKALKLRTPPSAYKYPQDYVRELKQLNKEH